MGDRHGRTGYVADGCRCEVCRKAERDYRRAHRAKARGLELMPDADEGPQVAPAAEQSAVGPVARGVLAEIETLPAAAHRPGLVAGALAMATLIDDKRLSPTHPSAMRQLSAALATLHAGSAPVRGKLAQVISMSNAPKPS